jgi:putative ABC transport system ATP-binding protein
MAAVEVNDLVKSFKLGRVVVPALRGVSFSLAMGEFACVIGPSGSGKSTLLNLIGGLDRFNHGRILVDGVNIAELNEDKLAHYRQKKVGFIFQSYNLIPTLTALGNVELVLLFAGVGKGLRQQRSREMLEAVGLGERMGHRPTELSGGEQQRVAIARALINQPAVMLADEPTGNLDTKTSQEIMGLMRTMNKRYNQTFIVVTHDTEVAEHADRVLHIRDGRLLD